MTPQNPCPCDCGPFIKLPVCGLDLPSVPVMTGRERVDHDMHIYINGNLESSGDGLSPETAVKSYEDAVLALSRYDGCNTYSAYFHFLSLNDSQAVYPDFTVYHGNYATFNCLYISGESNETTHIGACALQRGVHATISDICVRYIETMGASCILSGKVSFTPGSDKYALIIKYGGNLSFLPQTKLFLNPGTYQGFVYAINANIIFHHVQCYTTGAVTMEYGFIYARYNSTVLVYSTSSFSGCTSVSGKKYYLRGLSYVGVSGVALPGSASGFASGGSVFE